MRIVVAERVHQERRGLQIIRVGCRNAQHAGLITVDGTVIFILCLIILRDGKHAELKIPFSAGIL